MYQDYGRWQPTDVRAAERFRRNVFDLCNAADMIGGGVALERMLKEGTINASQEKILRQLISVTRHALLEANAAGFGVEHDPFQMGQN